MTNPTIGSTDFAAAWQALQAAVRTPSETDLLAVLAQRAAAPLTSIDQLADLVKYDDELDALLAIVDRIGKTPGDDAYGRHKKRAAARQAAISKTAREIGPLPPIRDPERRIACERDLTLWLETYRKPAFPKPWSDDHRKVLKKAQIVVLMGALFALAMPRGTGKTTICEGAIEWTVLYAWRLFAMLIGATDEKAEESLERILQDLESNPLLLEDFPEVCYPLSKLEGIHNRAKGQILDSQPTRLRFAKRLLVLPTVAGSAASGAIIKTGGLLSAIRGAQHKLPDGRVIRPGIILIDDPQTRESSESPQQSGTRERIVGADILGLAGPGEPLAALMTCTVTAPGDMADAILDRDRHPEWHGERTKLLYQFPTNMELWEDYNEIRRQHLKADDKAEATPAAATEFYRQNREAMDEGAQVAWKERHRPDELSAIQHAMNLYFRNMLAFFSEYQNDPAGADPNDESILTAAEMAVRTSGYKRGVVPPDCQWLTAFVDVHKRILYWGVAAWEQNFTGYLIDYGAFPDQTRPHFAAARARPTLLEKFRNHGTEGAMYAGLTKVVDEVLVGRTFVRTDGAPMRVGRILIDANWSGTIVKKFCRESKHAAILLPSHGAKCGPNETPISRYRKKPGELIGEEWLIRKGKRTRDIQHVRWDTYHWKSFFHRRLATARGDRASFTFFGEEGTRHDFLAEHLTAERRQPVEGERRVDVWELRPGFYENHYFDVVVGCCVGASICGAQIAGPRLVAKRKRRRAKVTYQGA